MTTKEKMQHDIKTIIYDFRHIEKWDTMRLLAILETAWLAGETYARVKSTKENLNALEGLNESK